MSPPTPWSEMAMAMAIRDFAITGAGIGRLPVLGTSLLTSPSMYRYSEWRFNPFPSIQSRLPSCLPRIPNEREAYPTPMGKIIFCPGGVARCVYTTNVKAASVRAILVP